MRIRVVGTGVAGLTAAYEFARRGVDVEIVERAEAPGRGCSWYAGGMVTPWCELESAEPLIFEYGLEALHYWTQVVPVATTNGSLVVALAHDPRELARFARRTGGCEEIGDNHIAMLEPDLAGRFSRALYFSREAHLDPRAALDALAERLIGMSNVTLRLSTDAADLPADVDWTIDCRGYLARDALTDLRGVKGEMLVLETAELSLSRPIRMLHPRYPVYLVPRKEKRYMVGATTIENEERNRVTARSMLDLIGSACAIHPAFGEAEIVELGADLRPAFSDNLPRIEIRGQTLFINGLYRHGFLVAPSLAWRAAERILNGGYFPEIMQPRSVGNGIYAMRQEMLMSLEACR